MNEKRILKRAVDSFGLENQINMLVEECSELIDAISKHKRNRVGMESVIEEMADVEIMIDQIKIYCKLIKETSNMREEKLERLLKKIEKGDGNFESND